MDAYQKTVFVIILFFVILQNANAQTAIADTTISVKDGELQVLSDKFSNTMVSLENDKLAKETDFYIEPVKTDMIKYGITTKATDGIMTSYKMIIRSDKPLIVLSKYDEANDYIIERIIDVVTLDPKTKKNITTPTLKKITVHAYYPYIYSYEKGKTLGEEKRLVYDFSDICSNKIAKCKTSYNREKTEIIISFSSNTKIIDPTIELIDACQTLDDNGLAYTLEDDVVSTGSCFTVAANNILFNCDFFSITGDGTGRAFDSSTDSDAYTGLVIENCTISNFQYSVYTGGTYYPDTYHGGDAGSVFIKNSNIGAVFTKGGDDEVGWNDDAGAAGSITLIDVNATTLNAHAGNPLQGAGGTAGGTIILRNSHVSTINSGGGYGYYGSNGGIVNLKDSSATTIFADGGSGSDSGQGGSGGTINLTSSSATTLTAVGGEDGYNNPCWVPTGGGGKIYLTSSSATALTNYGGHANTGCPGSGNNVYLTNSNITTIDSHGGSSGYLGSGGTGGSLYGSNCRLTDTDNSGGNGGWDTYTSAGSGGLISLNNCYASDLISNGGGGFNNGGVGGAMKINNSRLDSITSKGGEGESSSGKGGATALFNTQVVSVNLGEYYSSAYSSAPQGGDMTVKNSNITNIKSEGSYSQGVPINWNGGNTNLINSNVFMPSTISLAGANNPAAYNFGDDTNGTMTINNTRFVNSKAGVRFSFLTTKQYEVNDIIKLNNDSACVDCDYPYGNYPEYDVPANVSIFDANTFPLINRYVAKDGVLCNDCVEYTDLDLQEVIFGVSGFTEYSIMGEYGELTTTTTTLEPTTTTTTTTTTTIAGSTTTTIPTTTTTLVHGGWLANTGLGEVMGYLISDSGDFASNFMDNSLFLILILALLSLVIFIVLSILAGFK